MENNQENTLARPAASQAPWLAQKDSFSIGLRPIVGLHDLSIRNDAIMLCVERGQRGVQSHSCLGNERIKDSEIVTQVVRSEPIESTSAVCLAGPMSLVRPQKAL